MSLAPADPSGADPVVRGLVSLLPFGALVHDHASGLLAANARACEVVQARDEHDLGARWTKVRGALGLDAGPPPTAEARDIRVVPSAGPGGRSLRLQSRRLDGARALVFIETQGQLTSTEAAIVAAGNGVARQHLLAGLLHDANGPLNNFTLTLALLDASLARTSSAPGAEGPLARNQRYVEVLKTEAARLAAWSVQAGTALHEHPADASETLPGPMVERVPRLLRHHAAMHDVRMEASPGHSSGALHVDPDRVVLALVQLAIAAVDMTKPGGLVQLAAARTGDRTTLRVHARPATAPPVALRVLREWVLVPPQAWLTLLAGRLIVESQGGDVALRDGPDDSVELLANFPTGAG